MSVAHPIAKAWVSTGGQPGSTTGAQNYDEFADDAEITQIIAANPTSVLAVEMPHLAPETVGTPFADCLRHAARRLHEAQQAGRYAETADAVAMYRITGPDGSVGYGLWCMVDTAEISSGPTEPGLVIRNEDVFIAKVKERVALAMAIGHLASPVLLLQTGCGEKLHTALAEATEAAGRPAVVDSDPAGRHHEIWVVGPSESRDRLLDLAGGGELVVADGNHRSLAAQTAGFGRFLAVVTTPASVAIQPYNRLVAGLPMPVDAVLEQLRSRSATVTEIDPAAEAPAGGTIQLYAAGVGYAIALPQDPAGNQVDNLDHSLVERVLFNGVLGMDAGDKRITYVGGDYPASWLRAEVDAGRAELAVLIAPVEVDDFVEVNLARRKMPRKSTWFTPKARAGLVLADLKAESDSR